MLTYPIKMMFWKIVKCRQVRARVTEWAACAMSFVEGPGGSSRPQVPWSHHAALGCTGLGPPARTREGTDQAALHGAPTAAEDGGTAVF